MKMAKKAFSIALALVMLVNVFAAMSSAAAPDAAVDLYISTDKDTYAAGDEVVITVSEQVVAEVGTMFIGGQYAIAYNSAGLEPYAAAGSTLEDHGFVAIADGYDSSISDMAVGGLGDDINAEGAAAYGWDAQMMVIVGDDSTEFDATSKTDLFTFKMKIPAGAADGEYVIGFNKEAYVNMNAFVNDSAMWGIYGYDDDYGYGTTANYAFHTCTFTVGAEPELDVTAAGNQIRYNKNTDGSFAGFDVRTRATIDAAALQALVGATANDDVELSIVEAGFVYGADIDAATAATVAAGTAVDGYTKTTVSYIQNDGTNYVFTYLVTGLTTENAASSDFEAVGYITLTIGGTNYTFCYDAETAVSPSAMYNSTYARANTTFGWELTAIA